MAFDADQYRLFKTEFEQESGFSLPSVEVAQSYVKGYMKGVIDLWIVHEDQYLLLDWKSNWLGEHEDAYSSTAIDQSMNEHYYHLQYLIYLCSINRFLSKMDTHYHYDKFLGVRYIYLRAFENSASTKQGIFNYKPSRHAIEALDACFAEEMKS